MTTIGVFPSPERTQREIRSEANIPEASVFLSPIWGGKGGGCLPLQGRKLDPRPIFLIFHQFTALKYSMISLYFAAFELFSIFLLLLLPCFLPLSSNRHALSTCSQAANAERTRMVGGLAHPQIPALPSTSSVTLSKVFHHPSPPQPRCPPL